MNPADSMRHARVGFHQIEWRGVQRNDHLRAGLGKALNNVWCPDILANRQAKPHAAYLYRARHVAGGEIALVVEHTVIRQIDLVAPRLNLPLIKDKDGICDGATLGMRGTDDDRRTTIRRCGSQHFEAGGDFSHEIAAQHKVVTGIARQIHFRSGNNCRACLCRAAARVKKAGHIGGNVTEMRVQLGDGDRTDNRHGCPGHLRRRNSRPDFTHGFPS